MSAIIAAATALALAGGGVALLVAAGPVDRGVDPSDPLAPPRELEVEG